MAAKSGMICCPVIFTSLFILSSGSIAANDPEQVTVEEVVQIEVNYAVLKKIPVGIEVAQVFMRSE